MKIQKEHGNSFLNDSFHPAPQATTVTGGQHSESAGKFGRVFQKIQKQISVQKECAIFLKCKPHLIRKKYKLNTDIVFVFQTETPMKSKQL